MQYQGGGRRGKQMEGDSGGFGDSGGVGGGFGDSSGGGFAAPAGEDVEENW